MEAMHFRR
jgi:hypothetical protein